jgi:O-methyltransferase involved in polyketide biosynthesis
VLDRETRTFLEEDPDAPITIVSVGAGLCTRMDRLHLTDRIQSGKSNLIWVDLDLPEVIALRKRLQPAAGTHVYISKSLADPAWFDELPSLNGHRILVLIEGVFVYLSPQVIRAFLYDTVKFFEKSGAIQFRFAFDLLDGPALSASGASSSIRKTGARLHWAPWSLAAFIQSTGTNLTVRRRTDLIRDLRGVLPLLHWVYQKFRGNPVYSIAVIEAGPGR